MKAKHVLIAAALILCVCAFLDGWSTMLFLTWTFHSEGNPLFGPHPSLLRLWVEGTAIILGELALAWWVARNRRWLAWVFIVLFLFQAGWQLRNYCNNSGSVEHYYRIHRVK